MSSPWSQPDDNPNASPTPGAGQPQGVHPPLWAHPLPGAYPPDANPQPGNPFAAPSPYSPPHSPLDSRLNSSPREIRNGALDGVSVAAFVTAFLGFICVPAPVSVGLAIAGLVRTRKIKAPQSASLVPASQGNPLKSEYDPSAQRPNSWGEMPTPAGAPAQPFRRRGRGFAIWGLCVGLVALLLQIGIFVSVIASSGGKNTASTSIPTSQRPTPSGQPIAVASLVVGDCFTEPPHSVDTLTTPVTLNPCDNPHTGQVYAVINLVKAAAFPGRDAVDKAAHDACQPLFDRALDRSQGELANNWYFPTQRRYEAGDTRVTCFAVYASGSVLNGSVVTASPTPNPEMSG